MQPSGIDLSGQSCLAFTASFLASVRSVRSAHELSLLIESVTREMGFRYYALIDHDDLRDNYTHKIGIKDYPSLIVDRLITQNRYRRDPVIRSCLFAGGAFLWSDLPQIVSLDRYDRASLELGASVGLNQGITVPCIRLGDCVGSCTFAGTQDPEHAARYLGVAQITGVFAFQAARRLIHRTFQRTLPAPRLHPRPRDCVVLVGRGYSNKRIARALGLTPRTVDGYLTEARQLFEAHDRTELVVSAVLAGEIGLHELRPRQPE